MSKFHADRYEDVNQSPLSPYLRSARRASRTPLPYYAETVTFIWDAGTRTSATHLKFATTLEDKKRLLSERNRKVYAVWPGQTRTDIFVIDKPEYARRSLITKQPVWDDPAADDKLAAAEDATWD